MTKTLKHQGSSDRNFGYVMAVFFVLVALSPVRKGHEIRIWALAISAAFAGFAWLIPATLSPLNRAWTKLGFLLQRITHPIVMAAIFFGVVTPVGILLRLFGADILKLKYDRGASSYWIKKSSTRPMDEALKNQF